jgi:ATP-dependent DNA helicase RecQ
MQGKPVAEQEIGKQLLLETVSYAESSVCRPKQLLAYFGETMEGKCNNCDNCLNPKEQFEGEEYLIQVLELVLDVKEKFKADHIVKILTGKKDSEIKAYKHDLLSSFGSGKEKDQKFWSAVVRQALIHQLLQKDIENYGLLKITDKGNDFLKNPYSIMLSLSHDYDAAEQNDEASAEGTSAADEQLFKMLKDLRKKMAKKHNLPPFVIFQDTSLEDMATQYPVKMEELQNIAGVGSGKARKYGKEFVELIKRYVDDNDITRAQDMIVKSVVNKSGLKVYIIQAIDRKMSLEDIAEAKNLEMMDLLHEIESIVNSGTKLDITYYINEVMDEDHQDDIFEYFREESENGSIKEALEELGEEEYTEEDIRLMRIKFISELGN